MSLHKVKNELYRCCSIFLGTVKRHLARSPDASWDTTYNAQTHFTGVNFLLIGGSWVILADTYDTDWLFFVAERYIALDCQEFSLGNSVTVSQKLVQVGEILI